MIDSKGPKNALKSVETQRVQMLFNRMELILGMKSDLRRSRWPAGNPDNGTDCHAAQKAKLPPTKWIHSRWKESSVLLIGEFAPKSKCGVHPMKQFFQVG